MKYNVTMPSLGADMDQGKLMEWKINPGDVVTKGQTIATVETSKSVVEIESFRNGKVLELVGKPGEQIPVGQIIAYFDIADSEVPVTVELQTPRLKISPAAKKMAQDKNIDLATIKGSGSEGQIELKDIESLTPSAGPTIRDTIARVMARSKKEIPHYYLKNQVSLDPMMKWIDEKNMGLPAEDRLMIPVVLFKAIILGLKENPLMNGSYINGIFVPNEIINLGITIAKKTGGVLVPAILEAQKMSLIELNKAFLDLLERTFKGQLKNRELTDGSITVTNVGDLGGDEVFGIIFPPQVALVGLGRMRKVPVVQGEFVRPGFVIDITLSADHRVTDGLNGSRFLTRIEQLLMDPVQLEK